MSQGGAGFTLSGCTAHFGSFASECRVGRSNDTIQSNKGLGQGERLTSTNNGYHAIMQSDGNFVLYNSLHMVSKNAIWASNTCNKQGFFPPYRLIMQDDGNLVIYDNNRNPVWASNTYHKGRPPHRLVMQNDGNLVIYDANNSPTWATGTNR